MLRGSKIQDKFGEGGSGQILVEFLDGANKLWFNLRAKGRYQRVLCNKVTRTDLRVEKLPLAAQCREQ